MEYIPTLSYAPYPSDLEARETAIKELDRENKNQTEDDIKEKIVSLRLEISLHIFLRPLSFSRHQTFMENCKEIILFACFIIR